MLGERTLHRKNASHAMLCGSRTFGNVGRFFLRNVFNGNNHRISLPKPIETITNHAKLAA